MGLKQDLLKELLHYNSDTGIFTWKLNVSPKVRKGNKAGTTDKRGYIVIKINKKQYMAHRLAWLYINGKDPSEQIDHINHIRNDNRIKNLREVSLVENMKNQKLRSTNKSGVVGVSYHKNTRTWCAMISNTLLGYFKSFEEAVQTRKAAEEELGYHKNHGEKLECQVA